MQPSVSVVIPAFEAEAFIERTLLSLVRQTCPALEILVVDDASRDGTAAVVTRLAREHPTIALHRLERNVGVCAARNIGIRRARGARICMMDADDLLHPDALAELGRALGSAPGTVLAFGGTVVIDREDRVCDRLGLTGDLERPLEALSVSNRLHCGSGVLFERAEAIAAGLYDETLRARCNEICGDWHFYLEMGRRGRFASVARHLVGYRRYAASMSANIPGSLAAHAHLSARLRQLRPELCDAELERHALVVHGHFLEMALRAKRLGVALPLAARLLRRAPRATVGSIATLARRRLASLWRAVPRRVRAEDAVPPLRFSDL